MDDALFVLTFATALGAAIMAGVFFVFSTSVMGALAKLPSPQGIAAMQSINLAVVNPLFLLSLFGTALASVVLAGAAVLGWGDLEAGYLLAGSVLYLVGNIVVTVAFNIPRNDALAAIAPDGPDSPAHWTRYVSEWTRWNHVRTLGCLAATAAFILALR